jgi:hypothetical protein
VTKKSSAINLIYSGHQVLSSELKKPMICVFKNSFPIQILYILFKQSIFFVLLFYKFARAGERTREPFHLFSRTLPLSHIGLIKVENV